MKYIVETHIANNLETVVALYNDVNNYQKWMPGIVHHSLLEGTAKEIGAKRIFEFKMGQKTFSIEETVLENTGKELVSQFVSNGAINTQRTRFSKMENGSTRYQVQESFQLKGFMKIIGLLMPGSFKKQTEQFVRAFKEFAENQ